MHKTQTDVTGLYSNLFFSHHYKLMRRDTQKYRVGKIALLGVAAAMVVTAVVLVTLRKLGVYDFLLDLGITDAKPAVSEECSGKSCQTYNRHRAPRPPAGDETQSAWDTGEWLACSKPCSGGMRSRDVACRQQSDQAQVDDAQCSDPKPAVSEACNTEPCMWQSSDWGKCSASCGGGQRTRPVKCKSSADGVVDDLYCLGMIRPTDTEECSTAPCETYTWDTGEWLACSKPCSGGQRTRPVKCKSSADGVVEDLYCLGMMRPTDTEECNTAPCEIPNHRVPNINVSRYIFMNGTSNPPSWSKHLMAGHVRYYPGTPIWDIGEAARSVGVIVGRNHGYVEGYPTWLIWRERDHAKSFEKLHYWQHDNSGSYMAAIYTLWGINKISNDDRPSIDGGWTPIGHFRVGKVGSKSEMQKIGPHVAQQFNETSPGSWVPTDDGPLSREPFGIWGITPAYLGWKAYAHGVSIS